MVKRRFLNTDHTPAGQKLIKAISFRTESFYSEAQKKQIIVLYTLGEDGIVREYAGDTWKPFPIKA